jgi:transposase
VPALPPYIIEPIWQQFYALLPEREVDHPLGCHRPRIPNRVVFEKLVQVLVFGCAYHRIADEGCSATTLRERRDEWNRDRGDGRFARNSARSLRPIHWP